MPTTAEERRTLDQLSFDQDPELRRALRSSYLALRNLTNERKDDIVESDSEKFRVIIDKVEKLHEQVKHPREQVEDAKALLALINTLVTAIMSQSNGGITTSKFITCLATKFGQSKRPLLSSEESSYALDWKEIGLFASPIFMRAPGFCTMNGPMNAEVKQRKAVVRNKRSMPTLTKAPEEIDSQEEKSDTDKNMSTMFDILREKNRVRHEALVLNRKSFAQTVENLFALSFLVKDGRVELTVDADGSHLISPRNAPSAKDVASGKVAHYHFVFRFDVKDWKFMIDMVDVGEELMPHRNPANMNTNTISMPASQEEPAAYTSQAAVPTALVRKLSKDRALVVQEGPLVESPEYDDAGAGAANIRRCRRKLFV